MICGLILSITRWMMRRKQEAARSHTEPAEREASANMEPSEEIEALKADHEEQIKRLKDEHEKEMIQMREDYGFVIATLKLGSSSDAMIDLQSKINEQEHEMETMKREFGIEKVNLVNKLKRAESASMFSLRRNEEMSNKIYVMQLELEEMDEKHQAEIEYYQEKLSAFDGEKDTLKDSEKQGLNKKKRKLMKRSLEELRGEHERKMESFAIRIQDEKNTEFKEMTEKISKLEGLIDEMKLGHVRAIKNLEESHREDKVACITTERHRVKQLELECENLKLKYEKNIEDIHKNHKEELDKIRKYYEQEIGDLKRRKISKSQALRRKTSVDTASLILKALAEQNERDAQTDIAKKGNFPVSTIAEDLPDIAKDLPLTSHDDMDLQKSMESIRKQYSEEFRKPTNETNGETNTTTTVTTTKNNSEHDKVTQLAKDKETLSKKLIELQETHKIELKAMTDKYTEKIEKLENEIACMKISDDDVFTNKTETNKWINDKNETNNDSQATRSIRESIHLFDKRMEVQKKERRSMSYKEQEKGKQEEVHSKEHITHKKETTVKEPQCSRNETFPRQSVEITVKMGQNQESIISRKTSMITPATPKIIESASRRNSVAVNNRLDSGPLSPGSCLPKASTRLARRTSGTVQRRKTLYENIYVGVPPHAEGKT